MQMTLRVLSVLLRYPEQEMQQEVESLRAALEAESVLSASVSVALGEFLAEIGKRDLLALQENYVLLFDRTRALSLHLFEHVHGESRDRGQAMVDLNAVYKDEGMELASTELPDYLPLFLEFLSVLPPENAQEMLRQPLHVLAVLEQRLAERASPYASVFGALNELAAARADTEEVSVLLKEPQDDPHDLEELDRIWEEEAVTFGPGAASREADCPRMSSLLEQMAVPASEEKRGASWPRY